MIPRPYLSSPVLSAQLLRRLLQSPNNCFYFAVSFDLRTVASLSSRVIEHQHRMPPWSPGTSYAVAAFLLLPVPLFSSRYFRRRHLPFDFSAFLIGERFYKAGTKWCLQVNTGISKSLGLQKIVAQI
ncbi:hypothetical protein L2E82_25335 [Cichorium intybus]|uniref:Uncharacterized protein n=1 Tax=Cichorium intybus TaxID=13427 RepID=A0ACB9E3C8_CICIN|nr:hypothetical protein L2E82_25335 [Cichorium intybus]